MGVKDIIIKVTPEQAEDLLQEICELSIVSNPTLYSMYLKLVKELDTQKREERLLCQLNKQE